MVVQDTTMVAEAAVAVGAATAVDVAMTDLVEVEEEATSEEADSMPTTSGMEAVEEVTLLLLYNITIGNSGYGGGGYNNRGGNRDGGGYNRDGPRQE